MSLPQCCRARFDAFEWLLPTFMQPMSSCMNTYTPATLVAPNSAQSSASICSTIGLNNSALSPNSLHTDCTMLSIRNDIDVCVHLLLQSIVAAILLLFLHRNQYPILRMGFHDRLGSFSISGTQKRKRAPPPGTFEASMPPPCTVRIARVMARPMPDPLRWPRLRRPR